MDPILLIGQMAAAAGVVALVWNEDRPRKMAGLALAVCILTIGVLAS
jgi:hypothetical protein